MHIIQQLTDELYSESSNKEFRISTRLNMKKKFKKQRWLAISQSTYDRIWIWRTLPKATL